MRRWGEGAARWSLTLLLVALVGVTVASVWYWHIIVVGVPSRGGQSSMNVYVEIYRGTLHWATADLNRGQDGLPRVHTFEVHRIPPIEELLHQLGGGAGPPRQEPFNFCRLKRQPGGWDIPLPLLTVGVALPTLFLWYRRIRRRYRRGLCARCGYDLTGLAAVEARIVCPECGASNTAVRIGKAALPRAAPAVGEKPSPVARSVEPD